MSPSVPPAGSLSVQASIIATVLILGFLFFLFDLIRRHHLQERYSVLWSALAVVLLLTIWFPGALSLLSRVTGIQDSSLAVLAFLVLLGLGIVFHLTVVSSRASEQITRLAQEVALLRAEAEKRQRDARVSSQSERTGAPSGPPTAPAA